jgi:iron complex outermembrane recepter protein
MIAKTTLYTSAALMAVWSNPALAQEARSSTVQTASVDQLPVGAEASEADREAPGLGDVIVTAQRRAENLQRAALAVSAVTGDQLTSAGISDTANLSKLVPSVVIQPSGGSSLNIYVRGVGSFAANSFGENPVAFNFNGVYIARPAAPVGAFYDLERIEVVRGPQGTLYGRNATGGAINVLPRRPELNEFGGELTLEYGNFNSKKAAGALNVPVTNTVAFRLAGQVVDRDGYLSDGYNDEVGQALRASILWRPTASWSAVLVGDYFHQGGQGVGSVLMPGAAFPGFFPGYVAPSPDERIGGADPRSIAALSTFAATRFAPPFCGGFGGFVSSGCVAPPRSDGFNDSDFYGVSLTVEGDVGLGTLTVIPAYRRSDINFRTYVFGFFGEVHETVDQYSMEVRLASSSDHRLRYVAGAYYFKENQAAFNHFSQGEVSTTRFQPNLDTESRAVFGQLTFDLTSTFRVVAGARYTEEERSQLTSLSAGGRPGPLLPPFGPPFGGELNFSKVTWKAGIEWDVADRSLVYANVATGFKAGGFFIAQPPNNTFDPETLTAYTVGSKNRFLNNSLQINIEAFYWKYRDQQIHFVGPVQTPAGIASGLVTTNAGQARMYGAELELRLAVSENGLLSADVLYLDGLYESLQFTALSASGAPIRSGCGVSNQRPANPGTTSTALLFDIDCSGRQTINSPRWTANFGYQHTFPLQSGWDIIAGARTRIESSRYVTIDYLPETRQGSYMQSDAYLTLEAPDKRWSVTGFINNIEDVTVLAGATLRPILQTVYGSLRPPRTYGIRATARF